MGDEAAPTGPSIDEVMRRNDEYVAEARKKVLDPAAEAAALRDMFEGACVFVLRSAARTGLSEPCDERPPMCQDKAEISCRAHARARWMGIDGTK